MRLGLALPQYDYSVAGESPLPWTRVVEWARAAEAAGFDSLWLSDHLFLDVAKYGGPPDREGCLDPIVAFAALAGEVTRVRLGTLVLCEALRPAAVLAKALAGVDIVCGGRLDVGIGAGWYEPEYAAIGMDMPRPGERLDRLREAITILRGLLGGGPCTFDGRFHRADGALNEPASVQAPSPPIIVGGKGDRLLSLVADLANGWNTCWAWTPSAYQERLDVLDRACDAVGRDPASITRSLGLYTLCGEDERDLARRFERLQAMSPPGVLDGVTLDQWREGRLVGTVDEVREQADRWSALGVETLIVGLGAVPFAVTALDDLELVAQALRG
ncbi:MAG TPA: TIGR03619 family F420-dependent LLM class oxidoreductase [Acidimicrobiia bacterium]|nr:TIGR03619 family F420-dependent LLM class oxidoreductase [Acidimicrobiia bacterium]